MLKQEINTMDIYSTSQFYIWYKLGTRCLYQYFSYKSMLYYSYVQLLMAQIFVD